MLLAIDPGHGGRDQGARHEGVAEAPLNLYLAAWAQDRIMESRVGVDIMLTREHDADVELYERAAIARQHGAEFCLSIHTNAAKSTRLRGALGFVMPGDTIGESVMQQILRAMPLPLLRYGDRVFEADPSDDGASWLQRPRAVLEHYTCPCALLEVGYLTHDVDREAIQSVHVQSGIVSAIQTGIDRWLSIS